MKIKISNIGNTNFKGNSNSTGDVQKDVAGDNEFECQEILLSASDCLAAANKGGLYISISTQQDKDSNIDAILQSKKYFKDSIITGDEKILDGFKDGGRSGDREIIYVNRKIDTKLQEIINEVKENLNNLTNNNPETDQYIIAEEYIYEYVKKLNKYNPNAEELPKGKEILLGDIIGTESACCRHFALLFKILCDEMGIKADLIRGEMLTSTNPLEYGGHAWNIVESDDGYCLFDCTNGINEFSYLPLYESEGMRNRIKLLYGEEL